jgi:hypothetical protein
VLPDRAIPCREGRNRSWSVARGKRLEVPEAQGCHPQAALTQMSLELQRRAASCVSQRAPEEAPAGTLGIRCRRRCGACRNAMVFDLELRLTRARYRFLNQCQRLGRVQSDSGRLCTRRDGFEEHESMRRTTPVSPEGVPVLLPRM